MQHRMNIDQLKKDLQGEVLTDESSRGKYRHDASLFDIVPTLVVRPKSVDDIKVLVREVSDACKKGERISLTARAGGTDMSGGALTESIVVDFSTYFTRMEPAEGLLHFTGASSEGYVVVEPGVFYRDFEKKVAEKKFLLPSYPASRGLCAIGGMVSNDSGGEKTLRYGKTHDYVRRIKVVLSDGNEYEIKPLTPEELKVKESLQTFEGKIYREMHALIDAHQEEIHNAKPRVSKNSSGYNLWDIWDGKRFDLTKVFIGAQGTLGLITEVEFRLIAQKPFAGMVILFLRSIDEVVPVVERVMPFNPSSFESFDDKTFSLALKYFWGFLKILAKNPISLMLAFIPDFLFVLWRGVPKMILLVEFEGDSQEEVNQSIKEVTNALLPLHIATRVAHTHAQAEKYWAIRRESFNLLRQKVRGVQAAPFVDDLIVAPKHIPTFLPKLYSILEKHNVFSTIAGHVGDGNFHIIPLMKLADSTERAKIRPIMDEVYALILEHDGSITAEHNDGLIRTAYVPRQFGEKVNILFEKVKEIFDPLNIFNPGKKVHGDIEYAMRHIKTE